MGSTNQSNQHGGSANQSGNRPQDDQNKKQAQSQTAGQDKPQSQRTRQNSVNEDEGEEGSKANRGQPSQPPSGQTLQAGQSGEANRANQSGNRHK